MPGPAHSPSWRGGLEAIRDGWAALVLDHVDVLQQLESARHLVRGAIEAAGVGPAAGTTLLQHRLSPAQTAIVAVLRENATSLPVEVIADRLGRPLPEVMGDVTLLEIRGCLQRRGEGVELRG